jgi:hypothetical protein
MSSRLQQNQPVQGVATVGAALSGAATGVVLTYTVPAGKQAEVHFVNVANFNLAPTVQIRFTVGGVTVVVGSATVAQSFSGRVPLNAADTCTINVSALVAASTFDVLVAAYEFPSL